MSEWSKRVPANYTLYQKYELVPRNPEIADVLFESGDIEAWGRGLLKIKAECTKTNTVLPSIDTFGGGVSIEIYGCEKYLKLLRYPEHENLKLMILGL